MVGILQKNLDALTLPFSDGAFFLQFSCPFTHTLFKKLFFRQQGRLTFKKNACRALNTREEQKAQHESGGKRNNRSRCQPVTHLMNMGVTLGKFLFFGGNKLRDSFGELIHQEPALITAHFFNGFLNLARLGEIDCGSHIIMCTLDQRLDLFDPGILLRIAFRQQSKIGERLIDIDD